MTQGQFFKVTYIWFEFRIYLLDQLLYQSKRVQSALEFTHNRKNRWNYAFLMGITIKWNANNVFQDLNLTIMPHIGMYVYVYIYLPFRMSSIQHKVNFSAEYNRFEFRIFLLPDQLPKQGQRALSILLFTIVVKRTIEFIPSPRVLALCEMKTVSPKIWTYVAMSISCDGIHYTMNAFSKCTYVKI